MKYKKKYEGESRVVVSEDCKATVLKYTLFSK